MNEEKYCETKAYCWAFRYELVGIILLIIATFLTIITLSSLAIAAMFFVGMILCGHKYFSCNVCHPRSRNLKEEMDLMPTDDVEIVKTGKRGKKIL
ncbi:Uncharacterised protein (plasmid) [Legionella adelaidensis]|uniref:Uncharacterized protein n=1 Tax=Legionella adelaidensis TaxID=45056 RepID=A0A0W0R2E1_9GAMM|nr:hypothetical protein [Legionella adelaidensis]KTC65181.1 hypothetical protein Lade_1495 [Legionella adelaidensis]VEH85075.1 Uncharacterised protein [Legionella adelaidensis]